MVSAGILLPHIFPQARPAWVSMTWGESGDGGGESGVNPTDGGRGHGCGRGDGENVSTGRRRTTLACLYRAAFPAGSKI